MDVSTFSEVTIKGQKKLATALFLQVSHIYTSQKYNGSKGFQISRRDFFVPKKNAKSHKTLFLPDDGLCRTRTGFLGNIQSFNFIVISFGI